MDNRVKISQMFGLANGVTDMDFPQYVRIETVNRCNARCAMCYVKEDLSSRVALMEDNVFSKIIDELGGVISRGWGIKRVSPFGNGEPILDPKLPERIGIVRDKGVDDIYISTNASLLTDDVAKKLITNGLTMIDISMQGITKDIYEKIMLGLNYEQTMWNIRNFISLRNELNPSLRIRVRCVRQELNEHEIGMMPEFWKKFLSDGDIFKVVPLHKIDDDVNGTTNEAIEAYASVACIVPFSTMYIRSDGLASICDGDPSHKMINEFGLNVKDHSLSEIWKSEQFKKVREIHLNGRRNEISVCRGCSVWGEKE